VAVRKSRLPVILFLLVLAATSRPASAQVADPCLYNDAHFHVQDFRAQGTPIPDVVKMMDGNVCRAVMMGLAVTIAHDPVIDGKFAPVYYTQTDGQVLYYNAIQDVLVAHKYMALPEKDRARLDPLMSAFNLKDSRAGEYIKLMVRLYPGVWSGFGEIHFKKQEFSEKVSGGPPSLYSASLDAVFDAIGEMGAAAVVHCDHDTPGNLDLIKDPFARAQYFGSETPKPQYLEAFQEFLKRHPNVTMIWAHFMGNGRGVRPYPEHWQYLDAMLGDPAFRHVSIDISWGSVIAGGILDSPEHVKMTADLMRKYPDRFLFGSDQAATPDWPLLKKSYDVWEPLWRELGPELTRKICKENYARVFDESKKNIRAWEAKNGAPVR
jgi:Amidohydrolase